MGNRRFSVTTYILVGISLFALYFVGKTVNPPPPAPPKPESAAATPPPESPAAAAEKQKMMEARAKQEQQQRAAEIRKMAGEAKKKPVTKPGVKEFNATAIETDADYWQHYKDGQKGAEEMAAKVKAAKAKEKAPVVPTLKAATPVLPGP